MALTADAEEKRTLLFVSLFGRTVILALTVAFFGHLMLTSQIPLETNGPALIAFATLSLITVWVHAVKHPGVAVQAARALVQLVLHLVLLVYYLPALPNMVALAISRIKGRKQLFVFESWSFSITWVLVPICLLLAYCAECGADKRTLGWLLWSAVAVVLFCCAVRIPITPFIAATVILSLGGYFCYMSGLGRYLTELPSLPFAARAVAWAAGVIALVNIVGMAYAAIRCHHRISHLTWRTKRFMTLDKEPKGDLREITKETPDIPRALLFGSETIVFIDYKGVREEAPHVAMASAILRAARAKFQGEGTSEGRSTKL